MPNTKLCNGQTRRDFVRIGGLSALGMPILNLGLGEFFRMQSACAGETIGSAKAKSCILIWLDGGPTHLETFDPKPSAPDEVRGPMGTIETNVPGIRLSECLVQTAQQMDKLAIIRSMTSPLGEHNFGTHYLMTGYKPSPALAHPTFGATVAHLRNQFDVLPPNIAVPKFDASAGGNSRGNGFLPTATAPFAVGGNPDKADFKVRDLDFYQGLNLERLNRRRQIVEAMDAYARSKDAAAHAVSNPNLERAYHLIASEEAKAAFNLSEEPEGIRKRYGFGGGAAVGQSCLLARRLVERGVPFVTVNSSGWDTHQNLLNLKERYPGDRNAHLPSLDRALGALIGDLSDRGLLQETLVVVMGEFGRTPKINANGGRDHWPNVFSVAMAGGGVQGGQVIGSSDALGEFPKDDPVTPSDLAATIYTLMGINPAGELHTQDGRPVRIAPDGSNIVSRLIG